VIGALVRTGGAIRRRPGEFALVTGTVMLALLLPGAILIAARNVERRLAGWGEAAHLVVYLRDGAGEAEAAHLAAAVGQVAGVASVRRVSRAEAFRQLKDGLGNEAALLDGVEERFLPESIELRLRAGLWPLARVSPLVERLRRTPAVAEVEFAGEWANRLGRIRAAVGIASTVALVLALLVCVYVAGSAARLAAHARRDEIAIHKLVGATDRFVRAPFLLQGGLQGLLGAGLAALALWLAFRSYAPDVHAALAVVLPGDPAFLSGRDVLAGATLATTATTLATSAATRRPLDA
jgi:cell division transport system permease protein